MERDLLSRIRRCFHSNSWFRTHWDNGILAFRPIVLENI
uniref:Uncharacterized protein n=1 Tax=Rhizophora mucronata TaxID=61149 RepID=A0A2P2QZ85_RHIMU